MTDITFDAASEEKRSDLDSACKEVPFDTFPDSISPIEFVAQKMSLLVAI